MASRDPMANMSQVQRQIQQDWAHREYIELITCSIKKIADFLNSFGKILRLSSQLVNNYLGWHGLKSKFIKAQVISPHIQSIAKNWLTFRTRGVIKKLFLL